MKTVIYSILCASIVGCVTIQTGIPGNSSASNSSSDDSGGNSSSSNVTNEGGSGGGAGGLGCNLTLEDCDDDDPCTFDYVDYNKCLCNNGFYGYCLPGCDSNNTAYCPASDDDQFCGNSIIEPGETCDGNCPYCNDILDPCFNGVMLGDPSTCNVVCYYVSVTTCSNNDGCCPTGCTIIYDNDCTNGNFLEDICLATLGTWFPAEDCYCGFDCGSPGGCDGCLDSCNCGPTSNFDHIVGCKFDPDCE